MPTKPNQSMMPLVLAVAVILGGMYVQKNGFPGLGNIVTPVEPDKAPPSAEMQGFVAPIKAIATGKPTAAKLGHWYRDAASVIRTDTRVATTEVARQWLINTDAGAITGTDVAGSLPGFGAAKDKAIADAMGLDNVPLDAAKRTRLADVLDAIGWALGG